MVKWSKSQYSRHMLRSALDSSDKWKKLKGVVGTETGTVTPAAIIDPIDTIEKTDKYEISNLFNNYFANIGERTADSIQSSIIPFEEFLGMPQCNCFKFFECTPNEVESTLSSLKNKKDHITNFPVHMFKLKRVEKSCLSPCHT